MRMGCAAWTGCTGLDAYGFGCTWTTGLDAQLGWTNGLGRTGHLIQFNYDKFFFAFFYFFILHVTKSFINLIEDLADGICLGFGLHFLDFNMSF